MRGTAAGEAVVSQANTAEYEEGYDRIFGPRKSPQRGKWIWSEAEQKFVTLEEYIPPSTDAVSAPILAGRFYENMCALDGTDIGSRAKHKEYMKAKGYTVSSDYEETWRKAEQARATPSSADALDRKRAVAAELQRVSDLRQARYDREAAERKARKTKRIEHVDGDV